MDSVDREKGKTGLNVDTKTHANSRRKMEKNDIKTNTPSKDSSWFPLSPSSILSSPLLHVFHELPGMKEWRHG